MSIPSAPSRRGRACKGHRRNGWAGRRSAVGCQCRAALAVELPALSVVATAGGTDAVHGRKVVPHPTVGTSDGGTVAIPLARLSVTQEAYVAPLAASSPRRRHQSRTDRGQDTCSAAGVCSQRTPSTRLLEQEPQVISPQCRSWPVRFLLC